MVVDVSRLGHNIERLGNILKNTASSQIDDYQHRFSSMASLYDTVFKDLIIDRYDIQQAYRTAHKFFGKGNVNFVAIDGTEYSKPMFDMVIFYYHQLQIIFTNPFLPNILLLLRAHYFPHPSPKVLWTWELHLYHLTFSPRWYPY